MPPARNRPEPRSNNDDEIGRRETHISACTAGSAFDFRDRVAVVGVASAQSLSYTKGQNVAPAYEGWENGADGAKYFVFGYMNRNWEEEIDIPVGPRMASTSAATGGQGPPD